MRKKQKSVTIRLTDDDYNYLKGMSKMAGQTVSGYIRMLVNMSVTAVKMKLKTGEIKDADFKALLDD